MTKLAKRDSIKTGNIAQKGYEHTPFRKYFNLIEKKQFIGLNFMGVPLPTARSGYIVGAIRGATHHDSPPTTEPRISAPRGHYP